MHVQTQSTVNWLTLPLIFHLLEQDIDQLQNSISLCPFLLLLDTDEMDQLCTNNNNLLMCWYRIIL